MSGGDQPEKITVDVLKQYVVLDNKIRMLELQNVRKKREDMLDRLKRAEDEVIRLEESLKICKESTAKELKDVQDLQAEMKNNALSEKSKNAELTKEKLEYTEALSKQESTMSDLNKAKATAKQLKDLADRFIAPIKELDDLCAEQDAMLGKIFNGKYGSELENKLEADLDLWTEKRQRVAGAHFKWTNGRVLVQHAASQLETAVNKWKEMQKCSEMTQKYSVATECRNNLIAARQNALSAQKYLANIEFPYCNASEMETLEKATANIYTDMQDNERSKHAEQCYNVTHLRCCALNQWVDNVIDTTIVPDLVDAEGKEKEIARQLREERVRLLIKKAKEDGLFLELDESTRQAIQEAAGITDDKQEEPKPLISGDTEQVENKPAKVVQKDLKPAPSREELFGNMEDLKKKHEEHIAKHKKMEELNKTRQDQGLTTALEERRQRRMRQKLLS